ncbi:rhamnogalacturonan acetylesterase [Christiangramia fulva]|uniref:Rhamnogalacturonan acetylesterase n=1 Tax=Christiangramia fulva TaxID=2126553 RepID=A0A2R3Z5S2_9FLAO|nr:rhamnogalacturonan acetylesterase [Christiangramia fulva]AVR45627.1 rhamnogalacturonan acetylesterase [Christiangramia fulva]
MKKIKSILFLAFLVAFFTSAAQNKDQLTFVFGKDNSKSGTSITSPVTFKNERNNGFDFKTSGNVQLHKEGFTAAKPVYFSTRVPEGNYKVEVILGSSQQASKTTIKAESRRIMDVGTEIPKGKELIKIFNVNVRKPQIKNDQKVSLKSRELDDLDWDDKLTLEFSGNVAVKRVSISPAPDVKTIFLAGDSTMTDQDIEPWASWGQMIPQYFNDEVVIANHAFSGASLASFKGRKRLEKIMEQIKPGDYLVIGFAHNDEKRTGEGIGPWQSYTELLKEFVNSAKEKEANPILITPTQRRHFKDGELQPTHGDYPDAIRKVAEQMNIPLIDFTKMTTEMYNSWGDEISRKAFVQYPAGTFPGQNKKLEDNTHFNAFGANEIALAFIHGIREQNLELEKYLKPETPYYNPEKPNLLSSWTVPMSPRFESIKPDGN